MHESPRSKAELIDRMAAARQPLDELLAGLEPAKLGRRDADGWSLAEHLGHLAAWENSMLTFLVDRNRNGLGIPEREMIRLHAAGGTDAVNEAVMANLRGADRLTLLAEFRRVRPALLAALDAAPEADLFRPYSDFCPGWPDSPVIEWLVGDTYRHDDGHTAAIRELCS